MLNVEEIGAYKSDKILTLPNAKELITKLKSQNKKVGLCHGGFDLLHAGHVKHFESSKKMCDVLFVSLTSDKFIAMRKGSGRPIYPEKLRAYMVASIESVDYAVISDFNTGIEVIKLLKPSFYIKGPDYFNKDDAEINDEKDAINSVGGEIKYTDDPKLTTTGVIDYIKSNL
ncbi:hypothetical protein CMO93_05820 [Candidatus Woesearchaeota archaeon]|nr:hypothetical protein [Candidatus Woesearchaeota archaeon]|tara:strand:- start:85 stop:600 length:516 start_codon:yes stop_codon:yes gene_type:complete